ncbi:MAG TPA: RibD family protein [Acidobacteriota bacterium]|nr:RibD family protein [Acidobacteriota bacterium]
MNRPHVTCFMMTSLDGRIRGSNWRVRNAHEIYEAQAAKIPWDAWIVGRVTMGGFTGTKPQPARRGKFSVPPGDFVAPHGARRFAVGLDPHGKLKFKRNDAEGEHIIVVLTEQVSAEHRDYLRSKNVSYLIAGERTINLRMALRKLARLFPIKRLSLQGGGRINGSFLKAGLIDELILLMMPIGDGSRGTPTLFDTEEGYTRRPAMHFRLKSAKPVKDGALLLHYVAKR